MRSLGLRVLGLLVVEQAAGFLLSPSAPPHALRGAFAGKAPVLRAETHSLRSTASRIQAAPSLRMSSVAEPTQEKTAQDLELMDVAVIGAGPAGLTLAANLQERGLKVVCMDPNLNGNFIPNYGVWVDEVEPLGLKPYLKNEWPKATVFMGSDGDKNKKETMMRPYGRLHKDRLKAHLIERCKKSGVRFEEAAVKNLQHSESSSALQTYDGLSINTKLVVDATGHNKSFVEFEKGRGPGFQAAYGIEADIEPGTYPLPLDEMLLMDYRDEHMQGSEADKLETEKIPTFIYCMPTNETRVFFEETSLIATPAVPFDDLKRRMYQRLDLWGTKVLKIHEEEFCLIPMGGTMPKFPQRVIGFGGSAGLVHPATGYMISRTMELASTTADSIVEALDKYPDQPEEASSEVWAKLWDGQKLRQRDFANFGGEYLEEIGLTELRAFFSSFFKLPVEQWGGFLSHRLIEPYERLIFGLGVWANTSWRVRFSLSLKGFLAGPDGWLTLGRSVLPVEDYDNKQFPTKENRPDFFRKI